MSNPAGDFRDLLVWQKGMALVPVVYRITSALPPEETWGLRTQMRAAAVSIPSNIAEGYRRQSPAELRRFLRIAFGSLAELQTQSWVCGSIGFLASDLPGLDARLDELSKMFRSLLVKLA